MRLQPVHFARWGIPLLLLVSGAIVLWVTNAEGVGESLIAAAICTVVANALFRFSFRDSKDRVREEAARDYFDEHGHWPGEDATDERSVH